MSAATPAGSSVDVLASIEDMLTALRTRLTEHAIDATTTSIFDDLMDIQDDLDEYDPIHVVINDVRVLYNILRCIQICHRNHIREQTAQTLSKVTGLLDKHKDLSHCQTYKDAAAAVTPLPEAESN